MTGKLLDYLTTMFPPGLSPFCYHLTARFTLWSLHFGDVIRGPMAGKLLDYLTTMFPPVHSLPFVIISPRDSHGGHFTLVMSSVDQWQASCWSI
ncbi:hypothetical protein AVEN_26556-1 [Araneus ventricosus]|uniref:Uncharacterized protein n=1 Tax=Araneus ventricosus TaxID=182803 RepID=A0A4Y2FTK5_ARAVE|nr:hypothetical protein AVEN_26556-1 [Araneus ventricosus]